MASIHLNYANYLARHKWYVGQECFKRGLYLRGIVHDWDKLLPGRWMAYARFFSGDEITPAIKEAFGNSWRRHAYLNDHHWQHWISISDNGKVVPHEMTDKARREMLCDWIGAHKALGGHNLLGWYEEREDTLLLAPKTKKWLKIELINLEGVV